MSYQIATEGDAIVIRLPREETDEKTLSLFLDYLEFQRLGRRSQLTEAQAEALAEEVQQGAWQQVKHLFTEK